jgi:hypothetical protein
MMNERIRELMENASSGACYDIEANTLVGAEIDIFAESIIRKCVELVKDGVIEQPAGDSNTYTSVGAADTILEHFGIK